VTCDVNGCIITPVAPRARSGPAPAASIASTAASMDGMDVEIHEGDGWKLVGGQAEPTMSQCKPVCGIGRDPLPVGGRAAPNSSFLAASTIVNDWRCAFAPAGVAAGGAGREKCAGRTGGSARS